MSQDNHAAAAQTTERPPKPKIWKPGLQTPQKMNSFLGSEFVTPSPQVDRNVTEEFRWFSSTFRETGDEFVLLIPFSSLLAVSLAP